MKKRAFVLLAVLLVASLGLVSAASADQATGAGTLRARGDGLAALHGSGWMRLKGNGVLWVKGEEQITIEGEGRKKVFPDGWTEYVGFHGLARIQGRNVSVILAGEKIGLHAVGNGRVILWGKGTYKIDELDIEVWSKPLEILSY